MKRPVAAVAALLLVLLFGPYGLASADNVVLDDGRTFGGVSVESFRVEPLAPVFQIKVMAAGQADPAVHPVESRKVKRVDFQSAAPNAPVGRRAIIQLTDGRKIENGIIERYTTDGGLLVFAWRSANTPPGTATTAVLSATVKEILFAPEKLVEPSTIPAGKDPAAGVKPVRTPVDFSDEETAEEWDQKSSLAEAAMGFGRSDSIQTSMPMPSTGESVASSQDEEEEDDSESSGFGSRGGGAAWLLIPMVNAGVSLLAIGVYLLTGTVVGGIYLFLSSRVEGVSDFPIWKSFIAAAALTVFPTASFLLCVKFIPFFGCWAGLASYYGISRAIVMGAMEVMEDKASQVLHTAMLIQVGVFALLIKLL